MTQPDTAVTALVVGKDSSIHTVADLKGHSIDRSFNEAVFKR